MEETLEEAAEQLYPDGCDNTNRSAEVYRRIFIHGSKWQQERIYSDKEVLELLKNILKEEYQSSQGLNVVDIKCVKKLFEQFKK